MVASVYCSISSQDLQSDYLLLLEGCTDNLLLRDRRAAAQTNAFENLHLGGKILGVRLLNLGLVLGLAMGKKGNLFLENLGLLYPNTVRCPTP